MDYIYTEILSYDEFNPRSDSCVVINPTHVMAVGDPTVYPPKDYETIAKEDDYEPVE